MSLDKVPLLKTEQVVTVSMVIVFADVLHTNCLGIPLDHDIDYKINLDHGKQSLSIPPYRMALVELKE